MRFLRKRNLKMLNLSDLGPRSVNDFETFDIHRGSCTHLVICIYQLWYHRLVLFLKNPVFLTHLSRRLILWAYRIGRPPSSVVCPPHSLNIFSSETTRPVKVKFHMELLWNGRTKVYSNGPGHMTKMAAMPIYGKNHKNLLLQNQKKADETWYAALGAQVLLSLFKWWPGLTLTYLRQDRIWSLMVLYGKRVKQRIFQKLFFVCDLKLATDDGSDKKLLLTSKLCPLGAVCP